MSKDPEIKKCLILENAKLLFSLQGVQNTSVAEIAKAAGIAKGLVYYYFENKEAILEGVLQMVSHEQVKKMLSVMNCYKKDYFMQLLSFLDSYYSLHPKSDTEAFFTTDPRIIIRFHHQFAKDTQSIVRDLVTAGQALGYFQMQLPEEMLTMTLEGIFVLAQTLEIPSQQLLILVEQSLALPPQSLQTKNHDAFSQF